MKKQIIPPYLSIIIDDNSLPIIKNILGQIQDMKNIIVTFNARHLGKAPFQLLADDELRGLAFYANNYNCCELFYKMKKGIETRENEITLSPKADRFFDLLKRCREELQELINDNMIVGSTFSTKTQEFIDYEISKRMVRNSKPIRFFRKLLPFKKANNTQYEQLQRIL